MKRLARGVHAALLAGGIMIASNSIGACSDGDECTGAPSDRKPIPSGDWKGAVATATERLSTRLFEPGFPHGAASVGSEAASADDDAAPLPSGELSIPNSQLSIDRARRIVVRSYVDERGREVIEEYKIPEAGGRLYRDSCISGEAIQLQVANVRIEGETLNVTNDYTPFRVILRNEYAPGDIEGGTLWMSFTATRAVRGRGFHQQFIWREEYRTPADE